MSDTRYALRVAFESISSALPVHRERQQGFLGWQFATEVRPVTVEHRQSGRVERAQ